MRSPWWGLGSWLCLWLPSADGRMLLAAGHRKERSTGWITQPAPGRGVHRPWTLPSLEVCLHWACGVSPCLFEPAWSPSGPCSLALILLPGLVGSSSCGSAKADTPLLTPGSHGGQVLPGRVRLLAPAPGFSLCGWRYGAPTT